jgi:hypothetical protein
MVITSASPFDCMKSIRFEIQQFHLLNRNGLSRVTPDTLKRLMYDGPDFPSR